MYFTFDLPVQEVTLKHRTRDIRVRLSGDQVVAMDNCGADLTFFAHMEPDVNNEIENYQRLINKDL